MTQPGPEFEPYQPPPQRPRPGPAPQSHQPGAPQPAPGAPYPPGPQPGTTHYGAPPGPGASYYNPPSAPSLAPGVTMLDGQPALPVEPTLFQRGMYLSYWFGIAGLPVLLIIIRATLGLTGWMMLMLILLSFWILVIVQAVLGGVAAANSQGYARKAVGTKAAIATVAYYLCWVLVMVSFGDYSTLEAGGVWRQSPVGHIVGDETSFVVGFVGFGIALVAVVVVLAMISVESAAAREQAVQNYRAAVARNQGFGSPMGGQQFRQ